jgi:hypothetical protein
MKNIEDIAKLFNKEQIIIKNDILILNNIGFYLNGLSLDCIKIKYLNDREFFLDIVFLRSRDEGEIHPDEEDSEVEMELERQCEDTEVEYLLEKINQQFNSKLHFTSFKNFTIKDFDPPTIRCEVKS